MSEISEAKKLRNDFEEKLKDLQDSCEHKQSDIMEYQWAPGHSGGDVKVCQRCEKILEYIGFKEATHAKEK